MVGRGSAAPHGSVGPRLHEMNASDCVGVAAVERLHSPQEVLWDLQLMQRIGRLALSMVACIHLMQVRPPAISGLGSGATGSAGPIPRSGSTQCLAHS